MQEFSFDQLATKVMEKLMQPSCKVLFAVSAYSFHYQSNAFEIKMNRQFDGRNRYFVQAICVGI
jgi:hypothetical protein